MILKKQEKDNVIKAMYDSSNIIASIYDSNTTDLDIIFKAGTKYRYKNVTKSDYMRFEIAESQGTVFNSHIKKYSVIKLENVDISKILTETNSLIELEYNALIASKKERLIKTIKGVLLLAEGDRPFGDSLIQLKKDIDDYTNNLKQTI